MVVFCALAWTYTRLLFYCFIFINCYNHLFFSHLEWLWSNSVAEAAVAALLFCCRLCHSTPESQLNKLSIRAIIKYFFVTVVILWSFEESWVATTIWYSRHTERSVKFSKVLNGTLSTFYCQFGNIWTWESHKNIIRLEKLPLLHNCLHAVVLFLPCQELWLITWRIWWS